MRLKDALKALQFGQKHEKKINELNTIWSAEEAGAADALPLAEHPRPQFRRRRWYCLNGWWEYAFRPVKEGEIEEDVAEDQAPEFEPEGQILVPYSPECRKSGVGRRLEPGEILWYRRSVAIPEMPAGWRLILHFDAVDERCDVWWNGEHLGKHRNGYLAFQFDVTELLRAGDNEIMLAVRDDSDRGNACRGKQTLEPQGMYYTAQSGIWKTVWLEWVPEHHLTDLRMTPDLSENVLHLEIGISRPLRGRIHIAPPTTEYTDQTKAAGGIEYEIETDGEGRLAVDMPINEPAYWSPERPALYPVRIEMGEDRVETYFAMREFGIAEDEEGTLRLTLNGEPYFQNGVLDQGYWPESLMTPPADAALSYDIEEMKRLGFNMIRKHIKVEAMRWYYHCDRLGMIVWQDMVNGGKISKMLHTYLPTIFPWLGDHLSDRRYDTVCGMSRLERRQWEEDLMTMIGQLGNAPCIGAWVPFNEGWGQFDAARIAKKVKAADPTRIVDHASGWFDQKAGDVRSVHNYFRTLKVEKTDRAYVLSEYGGDTCPVEGHRMKEDTYGYHARELSEMPGAFAARMKEIYGLAEQGLAAAIYTQLSDIEEEVNGLLTYDRKVCKVDGSAAAEAPEPEEPAAPEPAPAAESEVPVAAPAEQTTSEGEGL